MSSPDDPFAAPPPDAASRPPDGPPPYVRDPDGGVQGGRAPYGQDRSRAEWGAPRGDAGWGAPRGEPEWGAPPGEHRWSAARPDRPAGVGTASLVLGIVAVVTGLSIIGGVVFGVPAVLVGLVSRQGAKQTARPAGKAVAGVVLGAIGLAIASGVWLYVRDDVARYQDCEKASVSIKQDQQCKQDLQHRLSRG